MAELRATRPPRPRFPSRTLQLGQVLAWLGAASDGRLTEDLAVNLVRHQRATETDPAIVLMAAVTWLSIGADAEPDGVKQLWYLVDRVSAQVRSRYTILDEKSLY